MLLCLLSNSCTDEENNLQQGNTKESTTDNSTAFELTESDAQNILKMFIDQINEPSGIKTKSEDMRIITASKKYIETNQKAKTKSGEYTNKPDSVLIYNFDISSSKEDGFAVVIGDKRIPLVMAYTPNGNLNDTIFNGGLRIWSNEIPQYVNILLQKFNNSLPEPQTKVNGYLPTVTAGDSVFVGSKFHCTWLGGLEYIIDDCYFVVRKQHVYASSIIKNKWHQNSPFNNQVAFFPTSCNQPGKRGYAGCGIIAIAQLMAHHKYPSGYNWNLLNSDPYISTSTSDAVRANEVSKLVKDIHNVIKPDIQCNGTNVSTIDVKNTLSHYGFKFNFISSNRLLLDIELGVNSAHPFIQFGQTTNGEGHFWLVDGYTYIEYGYSGKSAICKNMDTGEWIDYNQWIYLPWTPFDPANTFHINWGWGGSSDGWYNSFYGLDYSTNQYSYVNIRK